jgi:hypothetical protein
VRHCARLARSRGGRALAIAVSKLGNGWLYPPLAVALVASLAGHPGGRRQHCRRARHPGRVEEMVLPQPALSGGRRPRMPAAGAGLEFVSQRAHDDIDHGDGFGPAGMSDARLGRRAAVGFDGLGTDGLWASLPERRPCRHRPWLGGVLPGLGACGRRRSRLITDISSRGRWLTA